MNTKPACKQTGYAPQKPTRFLALVANSVINHLTSAAGRGVSRTAGGVTTSFLYDGGSVLLEKQGGTTTATYTYGNALIRKDGETPLFDGLGSERTVTNSGQSVTASLTLSAFGQTIASSGSSTSAYQFGATSGYRTEGDVGLTLVGCRFYDAQVGRFISRDTYLDQAPYAYCDGDPVNNVDPNGHSDLGLAMGALFGVAFVFAVVLIPGGEVFLATPEGLAVAILVAGIGAAVGEHLNDYLAERDKKNEEHDTKMRGAEPVQGPAPTAD